MNVKSLYPIIVVENLDVARDFYCNTMGFFVKHDYERATMDGGRVLVLSNEQGLQFEIMEQTQSGPFQFHNGIHGFRMNVDDLEAAWAELKAQGCEAMTDILDAGIRKILLIKDKNGINITLMQHIKK